MTFAGVVESLARRERVTVLIALLLVIIISIVFMLRSGDALMMMMPMQVSVQWIALLFVMWWTMMLAMMLPSAAPAILTFGAISRRLDGRLGRDALVMSLREEEAVTSGREITL